MRSLACALFVVCLGFSGIAAAMSGGAGGSAGGGAGAAGGGGTGIGSAGVPWHEVARPVGRRRARSCTTNDIEFNSLSLQRDVLTF
jgi:hypothetical protein